MNTRLLTLTAAAIALTAGASVAKAETVHTKTVVQQQDVPGVNKVNLMVFDVDKNGVLSMQEVGRYLFKVFDTDGNGSIDNIEFKKKNFLTVIPMEKETLTMIDFDNDGRPDESTRTYETFMQQSRLARFDKNMDGLSPNEFIDKGYEVLDDDEDRLINLEEWQEAYTELVSGPVNEPERYN